VDFKFLNRIDNRQRTNEVKKYQLTKKPEKREESNKGKYRKSQKDRRAERRKECV
jgi:hypothetical protein